MYKNYQSVKNAKVAIPAKDPTYLRRVSCGYAERSPLHFVLWLNFPPRVNIWRATYGVRIRETTPSLAALWLGTKKQKFCGTNQKPELPRPFGTGPLRPCPQGLFSSLLTFLRTNFFLARLDFFPPPLTAPGSPRMKHVMKRMYIFDKGTCRCYNPIKQ